MAETVLTYLEDSYLFESTAKVQEVRPSEDELTIIILDQTIFYPQGGGQPYDLGTITAENGKFNVQQVRFTDMQVLHIGAFTEGNFEAGNTVTLRIDEGRRRELSRIHSAGHLVDVAMYNLDFKFPPTKGYHFPDSPYVEYDGIIEPEEREGAKKRLTVELARLVNEAEEVKTKIVSTKEELKPLCEFIPDYLPEGKPIRVVTVAQNFGCPCGGTHVKNLRELGTVTISKIKAKNGKTRISYKLD